MKDIQVVPYEPKYRDVVRDCVYATGFGGENVEPFFEDRELFADLITLYYTDHEPESGFIPLVDGEPGGYLLGCLNTRKSEIAMKKTVVPHIIKKFTSGKYKLGRATGKYILSHINHAIRGNNIFLPVEYYPAHLHIDLFKEYRRLGAGSLLINTYINFLREHEVRGVHLVTSSFHTEAQPFYEKLGFHRYSLRRLSDSYRFKMSQRQYYDICYVKSL